MKLLHSPKRFIGAAALLASVVVTSSPTAVGPTLAAPARPSGLSVLKADLEAGRQRLSGIYAVMGGKTYFSGKSTANGDELWVTDGTADGTQMLKDIRSGSASSNPHYFNTIGSKVVFVADEGTNGYELWVTDGTASGTQLLKDINSGSGSSHPGAAAAITGGGGQRGEGMTVIDGKLYFSATTSTTGREPWVSDGTASGTVMLADVRSGATGSMDTTYGGFFKAGDKIVFPANDGTNGVEPMVYDGTAVTLLKNINSSTSDGSILPTKFATLGSTTYFMASNGSYYSIWKTDGTPSGTVNAIDNSPREIVAFGNRLLIFGSEITSTGNPPTYSDPARLWISDGTQAGTTLVSRVNPTQYPEISFIKQLGSRYIFSADDGTHGIELWTTHGTSAGTQLLVDAYPGSTGTF